MPWPRLKTWARPAKPCRTRVDPFVERASAGEQRQRIEIALQREARRQRAGGGARLDRSVEADRREAVDAANLPSWVAAPRGKAMIGARGRAARSLATMRAIGATHQRSNSAGGSTPAQELKI